MNSMLRRLGIRLRNRFHLARFCGTSAWVMLLVAGGTLGTAVEAAEAPLPVLILSGQNNHDWRHTTPKLKALLTASGRFTVEVTEHPEQCDSAFLARFEVILSDWNTFGNPAVARWPEPTRAALVSFVREGKGFVVVHAGGSSFYDWPEYQQLAGASWKLGQTSHGPPHLFTVAPVAEHPVTRGLKPFQTTDELWLRPGTDPQALVLATAEGQPIALVGQFGRGRTFTLLLGHSADLMDSPGFSLLLGRGTEWAATGKVTLPAAAAGATLDLDGLLKELAGYHFGDDRSVILRLEKLAASLVNEASAKRELARRLALMLSGTASVEAKQVACSQLSLIGSAAEVPALAKYVSDTDLGYYVRLALERIPGDAAEAALRSGLAQVSGDVRRNLINSLGARRSVKAIPELAALIAQDDADTAGAAIDALARIGGTEAAAALLTCQSRIPAVLAPRFTDALLRCAEGLIAAGQITQAMAILAPLAISAEPTAVRLAAFPVYVKALGQQGSDVLQHALASNDSQMQMAAIRALRVTPFIALAQQAADHLERFPVTIQVQLITLLGERGDRSSIPVLTRAAGSTVPEVKLAALAALGLAGDASVIPFLADRAAKGAEEDKRTIAESFVRLRGDEVNPGLVAALKASTPAAQSELVRALIARQVKEAVPLLLELSQTSEATIRSRMLAGLGKLGDLATCESLVPLLNYDPNAVAATMAEICRRENSAEPMLAALARIGPTGKAPVLEALPSLGGAQSLKAVRDALKAKDEIVSTAALRALANWPDAAPLNDLLSLAAATEDPKSKTLALRGVARLAPTAKHISATEAVELLKKAMSLGGRLEEQKSLLAALSEIPGESSIKALRTYLDNPDLAAEAKAAVEQFEIRRALTTPWDEDSIKIFLAPENLCRGSVATNLDGLFPDGQGQGPFAAIDGDAQTYWDETDQQPLYWLRVQLKQPAAVACLRLLGFHHHNYAPKQFEILCDGKRVKVVENAEYQNNLLTLDWAPTMCRTVDLKITGYYGVSPAVRELGLYSRPSTNQ